MLVKETKTKRTAKRPNGKEMKVCTNASKKGPQFLNSTQLIIIRLFIIQNSFKYIKGIT